MPAPSLGMVLPTFPQRGGDAWRRIDEVAAAAEAAGAGGLWACDHVFWPTPLIDCFVALSIAASATSTCTLGTSVVQLPLRRTAVVARQAASLQTVSGGRFVLGVGVGQHEGEYERVGVPYATRGRDVDVAIDDLRRLWDSTESPYPLLPAPGPIPIWYGGSTPAARRRAATRCEGWMPLFIPPHKLASEFSSLREEAAAAGRDPADVTTAVLMFVSVGQEDDARRRGLEWIGSLYALPGERFTRQLVAGDAARCAEAIEEHAAAGAEHIAVFVADDDPMPQFVELMNAVSRSTGS